MSKFSKNEQFAIDEKYTQLKKVCDGLLSHSELADIITERRIKWINNNLEEYINVKDINKYLPFHLKIRYYMSTQNLFCLCDYYEF